MRGPDADAPRTGADAPRTDAERRADHAEIDRLADELLPALVAKLGASGLGEIEVREGEWRVRLRMPAAGDRQPARRAGAPVRPAGSGAGGSSVAAAHAATATHTASASHAAHGTHAVAPIDATTEPTAAGARGSGSADASRGAEEHPARPRVVATSPGVGLYRPKPGLSVGGRVRAGDRLGTVDVLGVPLEVVAPVDGVIGGSYVEPGEAVEYGQELLRIELPGGGPGTPLVDDEPSGAVDGAGHGAALDDRDQPDDRDEPGDRNEVGGPNGRLDAGSGGVLASEPRR